MMNKATTLNSSFDMPKITISNGTIEGLKWLALLLMTGDHVNKYLFNETLPGLFEAGRLAMPIFVFVLAYNLARPGLLERGGFKRAIIKLAVCGVISTVPFIALGSLYDGWYPLNIFFTLLALTTTIYFIERGHTVLAGLIFLNMGAFVEYWWAAIIFGLAIWLYIKKPSVISAVIAIASCISFFFINENFWAMAAIPVLLAAPLIDLKVPRLKWAFYAYYPLHLCALWLIRIPMSNAGYLFF